MDSMLSTREAADLLGLHGITDGAARPWSRGMGRRVLATGVAGDPVRAAGTHWFDADRVADLLARPPVDLAGLAAPADAAFLLLRAGAHTRPDEGVTVSNAGLVAAAEIHIWLARLGVLPVVVTTCGFVVSGAEATGAVRLGPTRIRLDLRPAGAWFTSFERRRIHTTAGNHWQLRYPGCDSPTSSGWLGSR